MYRQYYRRVYHFALKSVNDKAEAEDLCQSIFLKIWENRSRLDEQLEIEPQLFRIAKGVVIDHYRAQTRRQQLIQQFPRSSPSATFAGSPDNSDRTQRLESVRKAIEELPAKRRKVFKLSRYHGLTYDEIADELSISRHTVHVHISKAIIDLKKKLAAFFF